MNTTTINTANVAKTDEKRFKEDERQHDKKGDNKGLEKTEHQPEPATGDKCSGSIHRHNTPAK
ncbi:hypothetical protein HNQ91_001296 [Filimonas zeae]|nr:hypothetical protein [Filimonas zeae]MDR6338274.1 hypothetical protein [Filimonas zeae]